MELIDTHCHLTNYSDEEVQQILARAKSKHVTRVICIGASEGLDSAVRAIELAERFENVWATVGIHPHDAGKELDFTKLVKLSQHKKVVAIGETGLDFFRDWAPVDKQYELFQQTIKLALEVNKPLIIHSRDAAEQTIAELEKLSATQVGGVFHCYSETAEIAKRLNQMNFLVSFTGNITFKKAVEFRAEVAAIPLTQIMLETDTPYMAPEPFRGSKSEPAHVYEIAKKIAEVHGVTIEQVAETTTATARKFFGI